MNILFEDKHIIVCIKPVGILSQSDESGDESMVSLLTSEKQLPYIGVLHRLDRNVGGVMVYAKTKLAAARLSADIADKERFHKYYYAIVHGCPGSESGELRDLLFKDSSVNKSYVVDKPRKGVKEAVLWYEVLKKGENMSLLKIKLGTGRTHQIRVQFSSRGMPLAGDKKYGARDGIHGIGLFSHRIDLVHPATGEAMSFEALPDMNEAPWCL